MVQETAKGTEKTVREVVGKTFDIAGFQDEAELVAFIVRTVENPDKSVPKYEGAVSPAAFEIRFALWTTYSDGNRASSAKATADLFHTLGREGELGWLLEETPDYHFQSEE